VQILEGSELKPGISRNILRREDLDIKILSGCHLQARPFGPHERRGLAYAAREVRDHSFSKNPTTGAFADGIGH